MRWSVRLVVQPLWDAVWGWGGGAGVMTKEGCLGLKAKGREALSQAPVQGKQAGVQQAGVAKGLQQA